MTNAPNTLHLKLLIAQDITSRTTDKVVKQHLPDIIQNVDLTTLAPHLFAKEMLTTEQLIELLDKKTAVVDRVAKMLDILKTKGPKWPQHFMESLRSANEHAGHEHLVQKLTGASLKIDSHPKMFDDDGVKLPTTPQLPHSRRQSTSGGRLSKESVFNFNKAAIVENNEVTSQDPAEVAKMCCCPKIKELEEKIQDLEKDNERLKDTVETIQTAEKAFKTEMESYKMKLQQPKIELKLKWQNPLPEKLAGGSLRAHLNRKQNKVYVCGGDITKSTPNSSVYRFCLTRRKWVTGNSITTPSVFFGSAMIKDHLVIIGGCDSSNKEKNTKSLITLIEEEDKHYWKEEWKEMPSERRTTLAMSNDSYLVVAGGYDPDGHPVSLVEILNCDTNQWQERNEALYLPIPLAAASGVFCDEYFYVLGGVSSSDHHSPEPEDWINTAYKCHEGDLMGGHHNTPDNGASSSSSTILSLWQPIADMHLNAIAAVTFFNKVFTFGGKSKDKGVSGEVYYYDPDKNKWNRFSAKMPTGRYNSSAVVLPKCRIMVVGGRKSTEEEVSTYVVETATLCDPSRSN